MENCNTLKIFNVSYIMQVLSVRWDIIAHYALFGVLRLTALSFSLDFYLVWGGGGVGGGVGGRGGGVGGRGGVGGGGVGGGRGEILQLRCIWDK